MIAGVYYCDKHNRTYIVVCSKCQAGIPSDELLRAKRLLENEVYYVKKSNTPSEET